MNEKPAGSRRASLTQYSTFAARLCVTAIGEGCAQAVNIRLRPRKIARTRTSRSGHPVAQKTTRPRCASFCRKPTDRLERSSPIWTTIVISLGSLPGSDQSGLRGGRPRHGGHCAFGCTVLVNGGSMISMLQFDQSTLANMTAALEYVCRKLPPEKDDPAIRKYIAAEILAACQKGQTSHGELASAGLKIVNSYLFPPGRAWLKALGG